MRKTYHTDLSDSEWARVEPHLPVPKAPAGLGFTLCVRSSTLSSTSSAADVPGAYCRMISRPGRPSITTSGVWRLDGVGAAKYGAAPALAGTEGQKPAAQCWDGRLTVGQNDRGGRRSTRLRWWEEGSWQKASSVGGHGGTRAQGLWGFEDLQALKTVLSMPELAFAYPRERVTSIH